MRRRSLLRVVAVGAAGVAGCLDASGEDPESGAAQSRAPEESPATASAPVRCRGEPVSVERSLADEPGYEDDVKYFPSNETVRFVVTRDADGPDRFDTMSVEEWLGFEAEEAARERARSATERRLGTDDFSSTAGTEAHPGPGDDPAVRLDLVTTVRESGRSTPTVSVEALADAAPRTVSVSIDTEGAALSGDYPVFAGRFEIRPA